MDLYAGTTSGYYRNWNRAEPYNLYAYPRDLLASAASASTAHDIGFRFGPPPPGGRTRPVGVGVLPGVLVHVHLVGGEGALAGVDGRRLPRSTRAACSFPPPPW